MTNVSRVSGTLPCTGRHILLIEDDVDVREVVSELLRNEGFVVDTAIDGRDGLDHLTRAGDARPAVIVLDWMMPRMSGEDLLREMRAIPISPRSP